jgi:ketosteroid isomerase-like protein
VDGEAAIREIVDRETRAWDTGDVSLLLGIFHPDMVWAWPATYTSVDPVDWHLVLGRFDERRWSALYRELFASRTLVHNRRETVRIEVSAEGDGALAVVDIDTLWREHGTGLEDHWLGRTCKLYALVAGEWKMTAQTGALRY